MHLPEHLLLMKSKVLQGIVPQAVLDDYVNIEALEQRKRPAAMAYASAFVDALERTSGAPRGDLWAKQKDAAPRVYLPGGFVSFSPQGEMSGDHMTPGLRRQRLSWSKDSLYPSQRKPYDKAVALYSVERRAIAEDMLEALQARISAIHDALDDALDAAMSVDDDEDDELDVRAERAAWQERHEAGRRNPLPLPEGFTTRFGIGVPDDYVPPAVPETQRVLRGARRGEVVTVGKTQWVIKRPVGDVQAYAYKHPSKRTKTYEILLAGTDDDEDEVVVFEIGGSGQQISEVLTTGPLRRTGTTVDL
jgi:hypothetical protein